MRAAPRAPPTVLACAACVGGLPHTGCWTRAPRRPWAGATSPSMHRGAASPPAWQPVPPAGRRPAYSNELRGARARGRAGGVGQREGEGRGGGLAGGGGAAELSSPQGSAGRLRSAGSFRPGPGAAALLYQTWQCLIEGWELRGTPGDLPVVVKLNWRSVRSRRAAALPARPPAGILTVRTRAATCEPEPRRGHGRRRGRRVRGAGGLLALGCKRLETTCPVLGPLRGVVSNWGSARRCQVRQGVFVLTGWKACAARRRRRAPQGGAAAGRSTPLSAPGRPPAAADCLRACGSRRSGGGGGELMKRR